MSEYFYKDMKSGDISVTSDYHGSSSITISADYIRLETCLSPWTWEVPNVCCDDGPKATNCINCGAPLSGKNLCRYCDTYNR